MVIQAPWTTEQVEALNAYQKLPSYHPYTCPYTHDWRTRRLVATVDGWKCAHPHCDYTQDWTHSLSVKLGSAT